MIGFAFVEMLNDGRLAIIDANGNAQWSSPTEGNPGAYAVLRNDATLALHSASGTQLWVGGPIEPCSDLEAYSPVRSFGPESSTGTITITAPDHCSWTITSDAGWISLATTSGVGSTDVEYTLTENSSTEERSATITVVGSDALWHIDINQGGQRSTTDTLYANESLRAGQQLTSANGEYRLIYQYDGNLVIYDSNDDVVWHAHTDQTSPGFAIMQDDGNFVIYNGFSFHDVFQTHTDGNPGARIILQDDGNLVIYPASGSYLWASFENP